MCHNTFYYYNNRKGLIVYRLLQKVDGGGALLFDGCKFFSEIGEGGEDGREVACRDAVGFILDASGDCLEGVGEGFAEAEILLREEFLPCSGGLVY